MTFWITLDDSMDDVEWRWMTFWMTCGGGGGGGGVYKFSMTFWMTLDDVLDDGVT